MLSLDLKPHLQLPNAEGALGWLGVAALAAMGVFGLQGIAWFAVGASLKHGDVAFPLALQDGASFGSLSNLIGWGFHVNTAPDLLAPSDWLLALVLLVLCSKLLRYTPLLLVAGVGAKEIEAHATGTILNWIVVPTGGNCVKLISVGDVAILAGMAGILMVAAVWGWVGLRAVLVLSTRARSGFRR